MSIVKELLPKSVDEMDEMELDELYQNLDKIPINLQRMSELIKYQVKDYTHIDKFDWISLQEEKISTNKPNSDIRLLIEKIGNQLEELVLSEIPLTENTVVDVERQELVLLADELSKKIKKSLSKIKEFELT